MIQTNRKVEWPNDELALRSAPGEGQFALFSVPCGWWHTRGLQGCSVGDATHPGLGQHRSRKPVIGRDGTPRLERAMQENSTSDVPAELLNAPKRELTLVVPRKESDGCSTMTRRRFHILSSANQRTEVWVTQSLPMTNV